MNILKSWYASSESQQAFLNLPENDQRTLELAHRIEADAMHLIYIFKEKGSIFWSSINVLDPIPTKIKSTLLDHNIHCIGQLVSLLSAFELPGLWKQAHQELSTKLRHFGLTFGMPIPEDDTVKFIDTFRGHNVEVMEWMKVLNSHLEDGILAYFTRPLRDVFCSGLRNNEVIKKLESNNILYLGQMMSLTEEELRHNMTEEVFHGVVNTQNEISKKYGYFMSSMPDEYIEVIVRKYFFEGKWRQDPEFQSIIEKICDDIRKKNGLEKPKNPYQFSKSSSFPYF